MGIEDKTAIGMDNDIDMDAVMGELGIKKSGIKETVRQIKKEAVDSGRLNADALREDVREIGADKLLYKLTESNRELAVNQCLIPKSYKYAEFNIERIKANIREQFNTSKGLYKVLRFNEYTELCYNILSTVRMKKLPERSYIIGAPNGFGKTSFVTECLITLNKQGYNVVPYISLWELAQLRIDNEHRMMKPFRKFKLEEDESEKLVYNTEPNKFPGYMREPEVVTGHYSYSQYINADCLFVHLTDASSKDLESHALYQLLNIRGVKGLPTIVMTGQSLDIYIKDTALRELVWDEILTKNKESSYFDRLYHVSTYKVRKLNIDYSEEVDAETGIVTSRGLKDASK